MSLLNLRKDYDSSIVEMLSEDVLPFKEPFGLFANWMDTVLKRKDLPEPNAMCLSTCTNDGKPSSRMVLLKSYDNEGFVFFTNYNSRKGKEMEENPNVAAVMYWEPLSRSVRIEGTVIKMPTEYSKEYFHSRPRDSQISAYVSAQSTVIHDRTILEKEVERVSKLHEKSNIPHPKHWGGLKIIPNLVEFWQGRSTRLHDRIQFRKLKSDEVVDETVTHCGDDGWIYERLSP